MEWPPLGLELVVEDESSELSTRNGDHWKFSPLYCGLLRLLQLYNSGCDGKVIVVTYRKSQLLNDSGVLSGSQPRQILTAWNKGRSRSCDSHMSPIYYVDQFIHVVN